MDFDIENAMITVAIGVGWMEYNSKLCRYDIHAEEVQARDLELVLYDVSEHVFVTTKR